MSRLLAVLVAVLLCPAGVSGQNRPEREPTPTPFTEAPRLTNRGQVGALLAERYPDVLRRQGIEGTPVVWLFVDENGGVADRRIERSSGYGSMDTIALDVAAAMRFTPARDRDRVVPVWINRAVAFRLDGGQPVASVDPPQEETAPDVEGVAAGLADADTGGASEGVAATTDRPVELAPTFTPYTTRPELLNAEEVVAALVARYPPILESAGIEGTVAVWLFIDEQGQVLRRIIDVGSGYEAMDAAALEVAATMRFRPARLHGVVTPVWISVPIRFRTR